jgi:hypothetical protein
MALEMSRPSGVSMGLRLHHGLSPICAYYSGAVRLEIRFVASQSKSAITGFNTLHRGEHILELFNDLMGVPDPAVALGGLD